MSRLGFLFCRITHLKFSVVIGPKHKRKWSTEIGLYFIYDTYFFLTSVSNLSFCHWLITTFDLTIYLLVICTFRASSYHPFALVMCRLTRYKFCIECGRQPPKDELTRCSEWPQLVSDAQKGDAAARERLKEHMRRKLSIVLHSDHHSLQKKES